MRVWGRIGIPWLLASPLQLSLVGRGGVETPNPPRPLLPNIPDAETGQSSFLGDASNSVPITNRIPWKKPGGWQPRILEKDPH